MQTLSIAKNGSEQFPVLTAKNLQAYISSVYSIPNLQRSEEVYLSRNLIERGCLESARKLVLAHLKYVVHIAKGFKNYGFSEDELIQEGNIGLMKAVKRFSPDKGVRLVTFAHHWIYAEIADYVVRNFRQIKIATTKAQRKLFFNLRKLKKSTSWMNDSEVREISNHLSVSPEEVRRMEGRLTSQDVSFSPYSNDDEEGNVSSFLYSPEEYLGSDALSGENQLIKNEDAFIFSELQSAIHDLDERSKDIIQARWMDEDSKATLHELADKYGVSAERIRQIESLALKKIKSKLIKSNENEF